MRSIDSVRIAVLASLTFYLVTSIGVIVRFESSISAATGLIVLASLFGGAVSWLVWSVSVRLLGVRLPGTGQVGVVHWLIIFWGFFGAFLLMALSGRLVVFGADWILKTRILGEQWNVVQAITGGQFKHATGWTIVCSLAAFLAGSLSLQCTRSWQYLRRVAAVRRPRPLPAGYDGISPARDSKKDYSASLQTMLAGEMESSRYQNWRTWLWPRWLAKRWGYVVLFWLFAVSVQTGLSMWMNYMQQFDTVQIVGGAAGLARRPENMLPYFSSMLLLALFAATELLVMIDQGALTARGFRDRPISVRALWLQTQVRHFCSAPVQLFLVGSVSLVCCLATRAVPEAFTPHAVIVLMAIKFAAATYGTASQVETSGSQLASGILRLAVRCLLLGLGAVIAMAFGTNALLLVAIDYGTAGLAWAAAVGCAATLAVLGIAVAELRWAERVHVPGGQGQDPGGAK